MFRDCTHNREQGRSWLGKGCLPEHFENVDSGRFISALLGCYPSCVTCSHAAKSGTHIASYGRESGAVLAQMDK
jgi:hypothetical protein